MKLRPWIVLAALALWQVLRERQGSYLGTRTMKAIEDFKEKIGPVARAVQAETGISARLGTIQAALESAYGASDLSRPTASLDIYVSGKATHKGPANNIFGFKTGDAWINAGRTYVLVPTVDYYKKGQKMPNGEIATRDNQPLKWPAPFRAYASWEESYRDWARLMQTEKYAADGATDALGRDDLKGFGTALSKRYAPNQNYDIRLAVRGKEMGLA